MKQLFGTIRNPQLAKLESTMKPYAAIITTTGVRVAQARRLRRAEDCAIAIDGKSNIVGVVLPRTCTELSMQREAERIQAALFGENAVTNAEAFAGRAVLGGYEAIRETINEIVRAAYDADEQARMRSFEEASRRRDGQAHLSVLFGRTERERRAITARYF